MTAQRIAGLCLSMVITSAAAAAQQNGEAAETRPAPASKITEYTFPASGFIPRRRVERTTESGARKVFIETVEAPDIEGKWTPLEEVVTETTRTRSATDNTRRDLFRPDIQRQRRLAETTQGERQVRGNADTYTESTWVAGLDGHLTLSYGYVEETTLTSPGIQQTNATQLLLSPEGSLREVERAESTEHQVSPSNVRRDSTHFVRDLNGRWVSTEARSGETRGIGSAERVEEETIQRQNLTGTLVRRDKVVTRTSESNGENRVVVETYSQDAEGFVRSDSHLALRERIRRSTTVTADGGRSTVEEIEARSPQAPNDPMRVTRRTLVTVRSVAPGRWITERQMFERDPNGRLVLVTNESEESTAK